MMRKLLLVTFLSCFLVLGVNANEGLGDVKVSQNYPNPAKKFTTIEMEYTGSEAVLTVYNVLGKLIQTYVVTERYIEIDVSNFEDGIYFYTLEADGEKVTRRMTVRK